MKKLLLELQRRWKSESPLFWKKILKISVTLGTSSIAVIGADKLLDLQTYGVPSIIFTVCGYIIAACAAMGLMAKITTKDGINEGTN